MTFQNHVFANSVSAIITINLLSFIMFPKLLESCCWIKDPYFENDPIVVELSPTILRLAWNDTIDNIECVDHFYVHYWKTNEEDRKDAIVIHLGTTNTRSYVDLDVLDNTMYKLQINAFEDGSVDCGDNWSNEIIYRSSKISK